MFGFAYCFLASTKLLVNIFAVFFPIWVGIFFRKTREIFLPVYFLYYVLVVGVSALIRLLNPEVNFTEYFTGIEKLAVMIPWIFCALIYYWNIKIEPTVKWLRSIVPGTRLYLYFYLWEIFFAVPVFVLFLEFGCALSFVSLVLNGILFGREIAIFKNYFNQSKSQVAQKNEKADKLVDL